MSRKLGRLRAKQIETLGVGRHHDGGGLYLAVTASGGRSWIFRYRTMGRLRDCGLGSAHTISLVMARQAALECRRQRYAGIDPVDARREQMAKKALEAAKAITFAEAAKKFIEINRHGWNGGGRSEQQWRQSLDTYVLPLIGKLPVQVIDTSLVLRVIEPIWVTKTETASRVRNRIELVLDWAKARGDRTGDNPAKWTGHLDKLLPAPGDVQKTAHHASLPYAEVGAFVATLRAREGVAERALEFLILTAGRTDEVRGARWEEVNLAEKVWTVPAERMKGRKGKRVEHRVALSSRALEILKEMQAVRTSGYIFPGTKGNQPIGDNAMKQSIARCALSERLVTVHGFRSTFSTWAAECTPAPHEVIEAALAHKTGTVVAQAYQRGDLFAKRRILMEAWSTWCSAPKVQNVIPIRSST